MGFPKPESPPRMPPAGPLNGRVRGDEHRSHGRKEGIIAFSPSSKLWPPGIEAGWKTDQATAGAAAVSGVRLRHQTHRSVLSLPNGFASTQAGGAGYQAHWGRLEELSQLNLELQRRGEPLARPPARLRRAPHPLPLQTETAARGWQRLSGWTGRISDDALAYALARYRLNDRRAVLVAGNRRLKENKGERAKIAGLLVVAVDANAQFQRRARCCPQCCQRTAKVKDRTGQERTADGAARRAPRKKRPPPATAGNPTRSRNGGKLHLATGRLGWECFHWAPPLIHLSLPCVQT